MLEASMPQTEDSNHSEVKPSRKAPLTVRERKMRSVARKRETHSALNVFIHNSTKQRLDEICRESGLTQAEAIERLIESSKCIDL
ncbi:replication regulatory protein RepA [Cronobacter sakazakii]|uniref:replication regulatory protein RepA n=2 Tax=Cronobacter sakazakii TaxID=28141 RepID=UPI003917D567